MRWWLLAITYLLASGCLSTRVEFRGDVDRPVRPPESVRVLIERPEQPYSVIAVVESSTRSVLTCHNDLLIDVMAKAAGLGGDAVILGVRLEETEEITPGLEVINAHRRQLAGEVIVFDRHELITEIE